MKFYNYSTMYASCKKEYKKPSTFYTDALNIASFDQGVYDQLVTENNWYLDKKPYYKVWPKIIRPLLKLDLDKVINDDISMRSLTGKFPITIVFQFSEGHKTITCKDNKDEEHELLAVLVAENRNIKGDRILSLFFDFGEKQSVGSIVMPIVIYRHLFVSKFKILKEAIDASLKKTHPSNNYGWPVDKESLNDAMRVIMSCILIAKEKDEDLIEPEILNKDKEKWEKTKDKAILERARKKGLYGWNIGKQLHVNPHWRRAHPALVWYGKEKKKSKIILRKGSLVRRKVVEILPTGSEIDCTQKRR